MSPTTACPTTASLTARLPVSTAMVARMGVTGELGYEIFYDPGHAWQMYDAFVQAGKDEGMELCGNRTIGTFRLEKVYHVYTRDIDETTNPYEAGLGWTVKLDKGDFIGRKALAKIKETGPASKLVGFEVGDKPVTVRAKVAIQSRTASTSATSPSSASARR